MSSVTQRISQIQQPHGGYVSLSDFRKLKFDDKMSLSEENNVHASVVGMAVDSMTRLLIGDKKEKAFEISLTGAVAAENFGVEGAVSAAMQLLTQIKGADKNSVRQACKLVTFDMWYRNPLAAMQAKHDYTNTEPDEATVLNIQVLLSRTKALFRRYPVVQTGFTFEPNGYTSTITAGDGDYLTKDTLWDLKVLKGRPTTKHTLQVLVYWIMGQHSGNPIFRDVKSIGIFNAMHNTMYKLYVPSLPPYLIQQVERDVIGY